MVRVKVIPLMLPDLFNPQILYEEKDFLIVYKPPGMHSTPLKEGDKNLAGWCISLYPEISSIKGRRAGEGGCLHRLDFDTQGLVLFARNQDSFEEFMKEQDEGRIIKEYGCLAVKANTVLPGFPVFSGDNPSLIESPFRPFGTGRKEVRPVGGGLHKSRLKDAARDKGKPYRTEIADKIKFSDYYEKCEKCEKKEFWYYRLKIQRGFRHQIRCHMAWIGYPILNDALYGGFTKGGMLALRAQAISFKDFHFSLSPINEVPQSIFV
ncbi:RNA pseudouridine synthase [Spirochaetia bacterium]|nr:RNA pseudouridine synthase [Spirochaetia bacterium]